MVRRVPAILMPSLILCASSAVDGYIFRKVAANLVSSNGSVESFPARYRLIVYVSFQYQTMEKIKVTIIAGVAVGRAIFKKIFVFPAPSILAASSRAFGIILKN